MNRNHFTITFAGLERGRNNLLAVKLEVIGNTGLLRGHRVAVTTSSAVFRSYGAAIKGARRAVALVERTGKLPNMCQPF
jgi:hypothetical protein